MMNPREQEEFYIGYLAKAPQRIGIVVRRAVIVLLGIAAVTAIVLVFGQHRFAASSFEFGNKRKFEGVVRVRPNPVLIAQSQTYALVAEGKHGVRALATGLDGKFVKLY